MAALLVAACHNLGAGRQRLDSLISESEQMLEAEEIDSAWVLLELAYALADSLSLPDGKAEVLLTMSRCYNIVDRPDSAIACLQRGLAACPSASDALLAQYYAELSATYNITGDMRACVEWGGKALPLMRLYGSDEDYAIMCGNTGIAYRRLGNNDSAAILYHQGLERAMSADDAGSQAYLANNLSVLYTEMGRYAEGISYADSAAAGAARAGDEVERLSALANKGVALQLSKRPKEAIKLLTSTLEQAEATNSTALKLKTINYLLKSLIDARQWQAAADVLSRGEAIAAGMPQAGTAAAGILESKMIIQTEQGLYPEALQTIGRLEELMKQQQVIPLHRLLNFKSRCLAGLGDYRDAYRLQAESSALSDSVKSRENNDKLDRLATNIRVMEKELQLSRLGQKQAQTQKAAILLAALLLMAATAMALLILWARQRRSQAEMRETRKYFEGVEQERVRFARELHDGACNELLAIGMQLRREEPDVDDVTHQISALRTQLRQLSHELMPPQFTEGVTLNDALGYYLSHIEQPAVSLRCVGEGWDRIPAATAYQFYRIAQETIGNIIVHQPSTSVEASLTLCGDKLAMDFVSEGQVVEGDGRGIGLQSLRERAESIGATLTTEQTTTSFALHVASR